MRLQALHNATFRNRKEPLTNRKQGIQTGDIAEQILVGEDATTQILIGQLAGKINWKAGSGMGRLLDNTRELGSVERGC